MKSLRGQFGRTAVPALLLVFTLSAAAQDECGAALDRLSRDLRGVSLLESQKFALAATVDRAAAFCFYGRNSQAMAEIDTARRQAGLSGDKPSIDWETVPLESLESDR